MFVTSDNGLLPQRIVFLSVGTALKRAAFSESQTTFLESESNGESVNIAAFPFDTCFS